MVELAAEDGEAGAVGRAASAGTPGEIVVADDAVGEGAQFQIGASAGVCGGIAKEPDAVEHRLGGKDAAAGRGDVADGEDARSAASVEEESAAPVAVVGDEGAIGDVAVEDVGASAVAGVGDVAVQFAGQEGARPQEDAAAFHCAVADDGAGFHGGVWIGVDPAAAIGRFVSRNAAIEQEAIGRKHGAAAGAVLFSGIRRVESSSRFEAEAAQNGSVGQIGAASGDGADRALPLDAGQRLAVDGLDGNGVGDQHAVVEGHAGGRAAADGIYAVGREDGIAGDGGVDGLLDGMGGGGPVGERRAGGGAVRPDVAGGLGRCGRSKQNREQQGDANRFHGDPLGLSWRMTTSATIGKSRGAGKPGTDQGGAGGDAGGGMICTGMRDRRSKRRRSPRMGHQS